MGVFENSGGGYLNLLSPNAYENGILFGTPALGPANCGIVFNNPTTPNGFQFRTGGNSNRMVISNTGQVGIGTTAPQSSLSILTPGAGPHMSHVHYGQYGDWYIRSARTGGTVNLQDTGGSVHVGTSQNGGSIYVRADLGTGLQVIANGGTAVSGHADGVGGKGIWGSSVGGTAGHFSGNVNVYGTFVVSGLKLFRIDHPDDPENKNLLHYCSESSEPVNFYSGDVTLDGNGAAVVELPAYFAKINKNPRYGLTAVGAPMPLLHVAEKVRTVAVGERVRTSFRIAGGLPGGEVSWRVDATRNDAWVRDHGAPVEEEKPENERGFYLYPAGFNQPESRGIDANQRALADAAKAQNATEAPGRDPSAERSGGRSR
jgi:hypothetical protein